MNKIFFVDVPDWKGGREIVVRHDNKVNDFEEIFAEFDNIKDAMKFKGVWRPGFGFPEQIVTGTTIIQNGVHTA